MFYSLLSLPDLTNKNVGHPPKFEFEINHKYVLCECPMYSNNMDILTLKSYSLFI